MTTFQQADLMGCALFLLAIYFVSWAWFRCNGQTPSRKWTTFWTVLAFLWVIYVQSTSVLPPP